MLGIKILPTKMEAPQTFSSGERSVSLTFSTRPKDIFSVDPNAHVHVGLDSWVNTKCTDCLRHIPHNRTWSVSQVDKYSDKDSLVRSFSEQWAPEKIEKIRQVDKTKASLSTPTSRKRSLDDSILTQRTNQEMQTKKCNNFSCKYCRKLQENFVVTDSHTESDGKYERDVESSYLSNEIAVSDHDIHGEGGVSSNMNVPWKADDCQNLPETAVCVCEQYCNVQDSSQLLKNDENSGSRSKSKIMDKHILGDNGRKNKIETVEMIDFINMFHICKQKSKSPKYRNITTCNGQSCSNSLIHSVRCKRNQKGPLLWKENVDPVPYTPQNTLGFELSSEENDQGPLANCAGRAGKGRKRGLSERRQPLMLMLLTLIGSVLNPVFGTAAIFFLIKSKRAWSQRRYQSAYKFTYQAGGTAIVGIIVTVTTLILLILLVFPKSHTEGKNVSLIHKPTSTENEDLPDSRFVGKHVSRIIPTSTRVRGNGEFSSRSFRRTTHPRHLYTKLRHSTHRLENSHTSNDIILSPTKRTEMTRTKNFNEFLNEDVATRKLQLTFKNRTMSVYFDPVDNRTITVTIPDFLQG